MLARSRRRPATALSAFAVPGAPPHRVGPRTQMLVLGKDTLAWASSDIGATWASASVGSDIYIVDASMHPTQPTWIAARTLHRSCFGASRTDTCSYEVRSVIASRCAAAGADWTGSRGPSATILGRWPLSPSCASPSTSAGRGC